VTSQSLQYKPECNIAHALRPVSSAFFNRCETIADSYLAKAFSAVRKQSGRPATTYVIFWLLAYLTAGGLLVSSWRHQIFFNSSSKKVEMKQVICTNGTP
jgi:hypothetical protein